MNVKVLLFDDFETLDAFGPIEIFGNINKYSLKFISAEGGLIKSKHGTCIMTEQADVMEDYDIVIIPGGQGTRRLVSDRQFIELIKEIALNSTYCLTICTGSALLAKTGLLDGRNATSNKRAFNWVQSVNPNVNWMTNARWVVDGKFYTSSGISAGMDMALGFIKDTIGYESAVEIAKNIEYIWNEDKDYDLFAL